MKKDNMYQGIFPYASELLGIYQPLLGWKSKLTQERYTEFRATQAQNWALNILSNFNSVMPSKPLPQFGHAVALLAARRGKEDMIVKTKLVPVDYSKTIEPYIDATIESGVSHLIHRKIGDTPPKDWSHLINTESMSATLDELKNIITHEEILSKHSEIKEYVQKFLPTNGNDQGELLLQYPFDREAKVAGYLVFLAQHSPSTLESLFFRIPSSPIFNKAPVTDPLLSFGENNYSTILSPIGIIRLYREYFFELDSFLGPPVGHVWLSPGGTVELIEVNTRKSFTEKTSESLIETINRSEQNVATSEDISDATKAENRDNTKFGFTNVASYTTPVFQDTATGSFSYDTSTMNANENTYKFMRQQSSKVSSEIKSNFKTTFRTTTEQTDTSSKRYVIQNTTKKLVNYELRRKMRKVGVQVQHIGVQLCWHTFVDDPARELGISKLVHIASPADLQGLKDPDQIPMPEPEIKAETVKLNIRWPAGEDRYYDFLPLKPSIGIVPPKPGYVYYRSELRVVSGIAWGIRVFPAYSEEESILFHRGKPTSSDFEWISTGDGATQEKSVKSIWIGVDLPSNGVSDDDEHDWNVEVTTIWKPSKQLISDIQTKNKTQLDKFTVEKERLFKEALFNAARERIKLASKITQRPSSELREEERTLVYRKLISQLMHIGTHESKHVVSELLRSIFDIDKMLYFVAPEWWTPRLHQSSQHLGQEKPDDGRTSRPVVRTLGRGRNVLGLSTMQDVPIATPIPSEDIVDWGGAKERYRDSYYITEDSAPAKLGSSLGWLLQLDGDNMRNSILNSPWVKAVIPIRVGKEKEAMNWLQQANVEGSDGLDAKYSASVDDPVELQSTLAHTVTIREALDHLIGKIHEFDRVSRTPIQTNLADPESSSNHFAGSLPTEAVFEHGFYPLMGGVKFNQSIDKQAEPISQWTEILPTDQIAALEVRYDPKTLQIIPVDNLDEEDEDG